MTQSTDMVITGSVAYDYLMHFPGRFADHILPDQLQSLSLSFLADSMRRERGGVAANIAYTMKLLGSNPLILATVGEDFGDYRRWLELQGLDTRHSQIPNELTATFFVSTDDDQNQIANFYSGAMVHARRYSLAERGLTGAPLVLISPKDPGAMLNYASECHAAGIPFAFDPQPASGAPQRRRLPQHGARRCLPALQRVRAGHDPEQDRLGAG